MKLIILSLILLNSCGATILDPDMSEAEMRRSYPEQFGQDEVARQKRTQDINECVKMGYSFIECKQVYERTWQEK
jgi:hypothetical protein